MANDPNVVLCSRITQILDSEEKYGLPYGTISPFSFAFKDIEFSRADNPRHKYYKNLRTAKSIKEYRLQVIDLYCDHRIEIDVNGESRKFPIQKIPIPKENQQQLSEMAKSRGLDILPSDQSFVFLSSLPMPRLLGEPPQGKSRSDYLEGASTNKIIDMAVMITEDKVDLGCKILADQISQSLGPIESNLAFVSKFSQYLRNHIAYPIGISLRGTMANNPVVYEDALRVPTSGGNFLVSPQAKHWSDLDLDIDIFCGEEDFAEIYKSLNNPDIFWEVNAEIKGLTLHKEEKPMQFRREAANKNVEIYLMTDEWVLYSVQRHLKLGFEQPWAYYYASSYPLLFEGWQEFIRSLTGHIFFDFHSFYK